MAELPKFMTYRMEADPDTDETLLGVLLVNQHCASCFYRCEGKLSNLLHMGFILVIFEIGDSLMKKSGRLTHDMARIT